MILIFLDPRAGRPRDLIFNSVSNFGPERPKTPLGGLKDLKIEPLLNHNRISMPTEAFKSLVICESNGGNSQRTSA